MKIIKNILLLLSVAVLGIIFCILVKFINFPLNVLSQYPAIKITQDDIIFKLIASTLQNSAFVLQFVGWTISVIAIIATILGILGVKEVLNIRKARQEIEKEHKEYKDSVINFEKNINKKIKQEYDFIRAKIFYTQGFDEEAWEVLSKIQDDISYEICLYKAMVLVRRKDYSDAITSFENALKFDSIDNASKARIHFNMARCWFDNGQYQIAIDKFDKAISLKSNYWAAYNNRAVALRRLGKLNEAIIELKKIISVDKRNDTALYNLACYYSLENNKKEALLNLEESIKLNSKRRKQAKGDPDFANMENEPKFNELTDDQEKK